MAKIQNKEIDLGITLYDVNKDLMAKENPLDPIDFNKKIKEVSETIAKKEYWMLLCNERKDYSVFKIENINNITKELTETITNRGQVISIDKQEDGNYEIWIRDNITKENFAYYLFDYSFGIIIV